MFKLGDKVVHLRHGAGIVQEIQTLTLNGQEREYLCIVIEHGLSTLMVPVDQVDKGELRPAMVDLGIIEITLNETPQTLEKDYKLRQDNIRQELRTKQPKKLAESLRDLAWLERTSKLTTTDTQLRERVMQALTEELALRPNSNMETSRRWLQNCIDASMSLHLEKKAMEEAFSLD